MNPDRTHNDIRFNERIVGQRLRVSPYMVGEAGRSIGEVCCEEEGDGIYEAGGDSSRDQERCNSMTGSITSVAGEGSANGM